MKSLAVMSISQHQFANENPSSLFLQAKQHVLNQEISMTELEAEICKLVEEIVACPNDEVAELAFDAARIYRRERMAILGLLAVHSMIDDTNLDDNDLRLVTLKEQLRDRLRALTQWAKTTGRM